MSLNAHDTYYFNLGMEYAAGILDSIAADECGGIYQRGVRESAQRIRKSRLAYELSDEERRIWEKIKPANH